jgi:hypothetical protein
MEDQTEQVRVKYVKLTNGLDIPFTDRHDGVPVKVMPGEAKNFPVDMALHFFGPDFSDQVMMGKHVAKRQGWNTPRFLEADDSGKTLAERWFAKLKIEPVMYKLVQVEADTSLPIPADPQPDREPTFTPPRRIEVRA